MRQVFEFPLDPDYFKPTVRDILNNKPKEKQMSCFVHYSFGERFERVNTVEFAQGILKYINPYLFEELEQQIEIAARNNFRSKYEKPKSMSTVELAEQYQNQLP